ncbi:MAG: MBL fold metallo-hydrolase [Thermomicrobiales bacterium]
MTGFFDDQQWFVVKEMSEGIFAIAEPLHAEHVRSYLVVGAERGVLIDTGTGIGDIRSVVDRLTSLSVSVINSHSHWDHIGGNWRFDQIAIHPAEARWLDDPGNTIALQASSTEDQLRGALPPGVTWEGLCIPPSQPTSFLHGGEQLDLGGVTLEVIHAPGHAPGLLAFLDRERDLLLSTDVVYPGPLYAYGADVNLEDYLDSLAMLSRLAPTLKTILPCHCGDSMPPEMIPVMRDALASVMAGRLPETADEEKVTHHFDGFAIYAPLELAGQASP